MRIQNILFPVDFSPSCTAMAAFVKRSTSITSARVTLLHVLEPSTSSFELAVRSLREIEEDRETVAREQLNSFLESEFPTADSPRLLVAGEAAARIAGVAQERGFNLIAMPTHAGVFRRMLLGSTTAKVLNDADCPVLTTQHAETISPRPLERREWVCAIGSTPDSERVLRYASHAAETFHVNLLLIHAVPAAESGLPVQLDLEERVQFMKSRRPATASASCKGQWPRTLRFVSPSAQLKARSPRRRVGCRRMCL
jgi:nucleotide-binding universal stress UspA family protein